MNKNIVKILFSLLPKGDRILEITRDTYEIYKDMSIKKINIKNILEMADTQDIEIDEKFMVKGLISSIAPINEPETYMKRVCKFREGKDNKTIVSIGAYPLPVSKYIVEEEKVIAFLYESSTESIFEFDVNYLENKIEVNNRNKFIPILIDINVLNKVINKDIEMKVKIKVINSSETAQIYKYNDSKFNELVEYFYDPYNMNINSIILELEEIVKISESNKYQGKHSFGVEYKLEDYKGIDIERQLAKACKKVTLESLRIKMLGIGEKNIIPCGKDVFIHIKDNYIGFYIQIDTYNRNLYRSKIKELEYVANKVLKEMKKIGKVELNFISDEEKKELFK